MRVKEVAKIVMGYNTMITRVTKRLDRLNGAIAGCTV